MWSPGGSLSGFGTHDGLTRATFLWVKEGLSALGLPTALWRGRCWSVVQTHASSVQAQVVSCSRNAASSAGRRVWKAAPELAKPRVKALNVWRTFISEETKKH